MGDKMKRKEMLDVSKFIMSLFIIVIHAGLFSDVNRSLYIVTSMSIARIAVPFFFISSGYYFYEKVKNNKRTRSYFLSLVKTFLVFSIIEVILYLPEVNIKTIGFFPYVWRLVSIGIGGSYWYITSLVMSLLLLKYFWKKEQFYIGLIVGFLLYLLAMSVDSYAGLFNGTLIQEIARKHLSIWRWPQAGFNSSILFLSIGAIINAKKIKIKRSFIGIIIFTITLAAEGLYLQNNGALDGNCYISLLVLTPLLFISVLQSTKVFKNSEILCSMSLYNYMLNSVVINGLPVVFPLFLQQRTLLFIVATVAILIASFTLVKVKNIRYLKR